MILTNHAPTLNLRLLLTTRRYLALAVVSGILGLLILVLAALPQIGQISRLSSELKQENDSLTKLTSKLAELDQVKLMPEFAQAEKVEQVLPSHKPLLELLTNLNNAANTAQVSITHFEISPGEIASDSTKVKEKKSSLNYATLDLTLSVTGPLAQVEEFMELIEKISPITTITQLSLNRQNRGGGGQIMTTAELGISTHYFTQSIKTAIESPLPQIGQREQQAFNSILEFEPSELQQQTEVKGGQKDFFQIDKLNVGKN